MQNHKNGSWYVFLAILISGCTAVCNPQPQNTCQNVKAPETPQILVVTATSVPAEKPDENARIILHLGSGDSGDGLNPHQQIIQNYEDQHRNVLVQLEAIAGTDYYSRLMTLFEAKQTPDIIKIGNDNVSFFVNKGIFLPLDDLKMKTDFDPSIYYPGLLEPGQVNGKQYLLPQDFSTLALYYNRKLFDAAGLAYPNGNWTWKDLQAAARMLTIDKNKDGKPEQWGIQMNANWDAGFEYWVAAAGGKLISDDGRKFVGYMDSEESIHALQFYAELYNKYKVAPPPLDLRAWAGGNQEFNDGKAAMIIFGRWTEAEYLRNPNIDLGIIAPPKEKVRANILFWGGCGVTSTSTNPEEAARFLTYYSGEESGNIWKDWNLPVVASVADKAGFTKNQF
ncbi:MAG TPA: sugar ABC transporter substrate-binding protein, partial [Leptolinea sp.]